MSDSTWNAHAAGEIRAELARRRMTARELAELVGEKRMWVQYRLAETTPMQLDDLRRIARALKLPAMKLLPELGETSEQRLNPHSARPTNGRAHHALDVRSAASATGRAAHSGSRVQRPIWTHAGVTA